MSDLYGLMAEFGDPQALVRAAAQARQEGYERMDAYSPFPIEGLSRSMGPERPKNGPKNETKNNVPWVTLIGGITGGLTGYLMQWYANVVDYPLNIGGHPYNSWPAFIPVTFELTILFGALGAAFGMLALNGLPRPFHPVFGAPGFAKASKDRFFFCIESTDPRFERERTETFLWGLEPLRVAEVRDDDL